MKPAIGRIVHYTLPSGKPKVNGSSTFPAIITSVHGGENDLVNLRLFLDTNPNDPPGADEWVTSIERDVPGVQGTWSWPPEAPVGVDAIDQLFSQIHEGLQSGFRLEAGRVSGVAPPPSKDD